MLFSCGAEDKKREICAAYGCDNSSIGSNSQGSPVSAKGDKGDKGDRGDKGDSGTNGLSIVTVTVDATINQCVNGGTVLVIAQDAYGDNLYRISDPNQQYIIICNGEVGAQGQNGQNGMSPHPITFMAACGVNSSPWKEIFLCLDNGQVLASFSDNLSGLNTRLSFIGAGNYENSDNSGCIFNVSIDNNENTIVSWNQGSNQYSSWTAGTSTCTSN